MRRPFLLGSALVTAAALLLPVAPASAEEPPVAPIVLPVSPPGSLPPVQGPLPIKPKAVLKPKPAAPKALGPKAWAPSWEGTLASGSPRAAVKAAQLRLTVLGYWAGTPSGRFGPQTSQAVMALQKASGLPRTGRLDTAARKVLIAGTRPQARTRTGTTLEIDIKRQLLLSVWGDPYAKLFLHHIECCIE